MPVLDLAGRLAGTGPRVLHHDAEFAQERLEGCGALARPAVEDGRLLGQHRGRIAPASSRFFEGVDHVVGLGDPEDLGGDGDQA